MNKTVKHLLIFVSGFATGVALTAHIYNKVTNHYEPEELDLDELNDMFENVNVPYDDPEELFDDDTIPCEAESSAAKTKNR